MILGDTNPSSWFVDPDSLKEGVYIDKNRLLFVAKLYFGDEWKKAHTNALLDAPQFASESNHWYLFEDTDELPFGRYVLPSLCYRSPLDGPREMQTTLLMNFSRRGAGQGELVLDDFVMRGWAYRFVKYGLCLGSELFPNPGMNSKEAMENDGYGEI